jgi:hypothetical protein
MPEASQKDDDGRLLRCGYSGHAPADALGVKEELEKALAQEGKRGKIIARAKGTVQREAPH